MVLKMYQKVYIIQKTYNELKILTATTKEI